MIYDAKEKQVCKICGFELLHNKQGWFTGHLTDTHGISLEGYLLTHFYTKEQLQCKNELCENLVGLRRGKPKNYCSKSCAMKKNSTCKWCGTLFFSNHKGTKTCSPECAENLRRQNITEWHANMTEEEKEKHFHTIISKTAKTRKKNNTPSWNSGKTGIYSEETIQKIRDATLRQMEDHKIVKTKIEIIMDELLDTLKVEHKYSFILDQHQYDFVLSDKNIIIECDGDYWHANPKFFSNPLPWQIERIEKDRLKNEIAISNGYQILRFWEDDIINRIEDVKQTIASYL